MTTLDITPKWEAIMDPMLAVLQNPKADKEAKIVVRQELLRLARIVDNQNNIKSHIQSITNK